jgi:hypothetical protein
MIQNKKTQEQDQLRGMYTFIKCLSLNSLGYSMSFCTT